MAEQQSVLLAREKVLNDQLLQLEIQKLDLDGSNKGKLDGLIDGIKTKLAEINKKLENSEIQNDSNAAYITSMKISNLSTHFKSINKFLPGSNCEAWIDELDRLYAVHIKPELNDYPTLETSFVRLCKTYLDKVIFTQMLNSKMDTDTYDQFRSYMLKNHGSRQSVFSFLQKPFDLKLQDDDKAVTTFASKLDKSMREAQLRISEKYKSDHNGAEMQIEHVFQIMSSMLISEQLRLQEPVIYAHITKKIDKMWSPISIAQEAQVFVDRGIGNNGDDGYNVNTVSTGSKGKSEKRNTRLSADEYEKAISNGECLKFMMDKPCKTQPCPYKHVDKYGKLVSNVPGNGNTRAQGNLNGDNKVNSKGNSDSTATTGTADYDAQTNQFIDLFEPVNFN